MINAIHHNPLALYRRLLQAVLTEIRPAPLASFLKHILGNDRIIVSTQQGRFWIDPISNLGVRLCREGYYEPGMQRTIEKFLSRGATFVDLGANEGYFTVIGAKLCGPGGRVVAIEPQNRLLPVIAENLRINRVEWASVLNVAVADSEVTATIHLASDINTGGSGMHRSTKYRLPTQQVAARTLAQVLDGEKLARVDLMKVDIEGFEYEALLGSPEVFRERRVKALALELHPTILTNRKKDASLITKMLEGYNYRMTEILGNTVWLAPE
jgi:FkbM family methyltransferase